MSAPEDFKHNPAHTTLVFTERACFSGDDFSYQLLLPLSGKSQVWLAEDVLAKERAQKPKTRSFGQEQAAQPIHVVIKKATFEDYPSLLRLHGEYEALQHISESPLKGRMHMQKPLKYVDINTCKTRHGDLSNEPFLVIPRINQARPLFDLCRAPGEALAQTYAPALFDILAVLEERQLIHRDISPNNLLVDDTGHLWLIDFGHVLHTSEVNKKAIQALGSGTQGFMAPEVATQGSNSSLTFAADQFSVARILLMLLTGELPDAFGQVQPQLNKVAADLRPVLQKAMTENPAQRYANTAALCEAWAGVFAARVKTDTFQRQQESAKNTTQKQSQEPNVFTAKRGDANYNKSQKVGLWGISIIGALSLLSYILVRDANESSAKNIDEEVVVSFPERQIYEPEMVDIPAGIFNMGDLTGNGNSRKEEPVLKGVKIKNFLMSKYEITFAEYDVFAKGASRGLPADEKWGRDRRPVINVSWEDAVAYAQWLSAITGKRYRLPTEAEWEYAARAGTTTDFASGPCIDTSRANFDGNESFNKCGAETGSFLGRTAAVGSYLPNNYGLYDMHGNVWEWTLDCYHDGYKNAPVVMKQQGGAWVDNGNVCIDGYRVIRGGSWEDSPYYLRSASRNDGHESSDRGNFVGFRLVQDIDIVSIQDN